MLNDNFIKYPFNNLVMIIDIKNNIKCRIYLLELSILINILRLI